MSRRSSTGSRLLHLDTFSGIAGNMFLGALLDAGLPRRELERGLAGLGVAHRLRVSRVRRGPLAARYVRVLASPGRGRRWPQIRRQLERARLPGPVRERALAIFSALARAEAKVHGIAEERVHFHEVGAVDALVDVTGAALALELLGVERVTASPPALGHGSVDSRHGRLPLPAPATLELLRGIPTVPAHVDFETVTPTGAAILRTIVDGFGPMPALVIERVGHGAGDEREAPLPNVLRAVLGRARGFESDRVVCLETNLDDLPPEQFEYVMERLFAAGALDVTLQHQQMKKSRPGFLLRVLVRPAERLAVAGTLFAETPTLGVRVQEWDRLTLPRETLRVRTPQGVVSVKVVRRPDGSLDVSAEYDDCRRVARRSGLPLREVVRRAEGMARARLGQAPR